MTTRMKQIWPTLPLRTILLTLYPLVWSSSHAAVIYSTGFEAPGFKSGAFGTGAALHTQSPDWGLAIEKEGVDRVRLATIQSAVFKTGRQALEVSAGAANSTQSGVSIEKQNHEKRISFSADLRLASSKAQGIWQFAAGDHSSGFAGGINISANDGRLELLTPGFRQAQTDVKRDAWHHVSLAFDLEKQTYQVVIDGATIAADVPFLSKADKIRFFQFVTFRGGGDTAYLDNFSIGSADEAGQAAEPPPGDGYRAWKNEKTGTRLDAVVVGKSADGSEVDLMRHDGKVITLKTDILIPADRLIVKNWEKTSTTPLPPAVTTDPKLESKAPAPNGTEKANPGGIVINKQSILEQAKGGFGVQIDELGTVFDSYRVAENDLAAHPEVVIFDGLPGFTPTAPVTYLMPRGKAEALLPKRLGPVSRLKAVAPGFPPGMIIYNYDIRLGPYSRMTIMVDGADQVVTLQFKAQNKHVPMQPCDFTYQIATRDFIDVGWGGAAVEVIGTEKTTSRYLVNIRGKDTITWFAPVPLIRQILFNVQEKQKTGRK